jgi:hypothetical protein
MPKPIDVKPKNFSVKKVLFDNGDFSMVIGDWINEKNVLAMRWNGDDKENSGYPKTFGNPMWFIIHNELKHPIIQALLHQNPETIDKLLD